MRITSLPTVCAMPGFCHGHGDKRDSTSLSIQDRDQGGLLVTCFVGCDRQTIIAALERDTGLTIWQAWTPTGATQGRFSRLAGVGGGTRTPKTTPAAAPDGGHGPDPDGPGGLAERRYCQGQRNRPSGLALAQHAESLEAGVSPAVVPPLAAGLGALAGQGAAHRRRFHRRPGGSTPGSVLPALPSTGPGLCRRSTPSTATRPESRSWTRTPAAMRCAESSLWAAFPAALDTSTITSASSLTCPGDPSTAPRFLRTWANGV